VAGLNPRSCRTGRRMRQAGYQDSRRIGPRPKLIRRRYRCRLRSALPMSFPQEVVPTARWFGTDWAIHWWAGLRPACKRRHYTTSGRGLRARQVCTPCDLLVYAPAAQRSRGDGQSILAPQSRNRTGEKKRTISPQRTQSKIFFPNLACFASFHKSSLCQFRNSNVN